LLAEESIDSDVLDLSVDADVAQPKPGGLDRPKEAGWVSVGSP
jgi:hypothetical protein